MIAYLLFAVAALLGLFTLRERFETSTSAGTIKAPPYDEAEQARIVALVPGQLEKTKQLVRTVSQASGGTITDAEVDSKAKTTLLRTVQDFYTDVYENRTDPVTEDIITSAVDAKVRTLPPELVEPVKTLFTQLLKAYFMSGASTRMVAGTEAAFTELDENKDDKLSRGEFLTAEEQAQALLAETQASQAESIEELRGQSEFEAAIGKYQAARLEYKMKGTSTAKAIAEQWKAWIESKIQEAQAAVDANANAITTFIQTYESSDSELQDLQKKLQEVRTKGPELQTAYETEREATTSAEEMDASSYYIKAGIIVGIVTLGFVVTLYA